MDILFQNVLEISFFTSVAILILGLLSHLLGKRYGVIWRYFLWLVIGIRLIVPFHFIASQPIVEIPTPQGRMQTIAETEPVSTEVDALSDVSFPMVDSVKIQNGLGQPSEMESLSTTLNAIWERLWVLWLFGMVISFIWQGQKYRRFLLNLNRNSRSIRDAEVLEVYYDACREMDIKKRPEIFYCGILPSPLCVGFLRQKIYLNHEEYKAEQLSYILKHELVHCKRRDIWYKALLVIARGIHFFNPFVHWMVRLAEHDIEYSCDSLVLEKCSLSQRQDYGLTILDSIRQGGQTNPLSTAFHGNKEELKVRIDHIFDMKKKKRGTLLLLFLLLLVWGGTAFVGCGEKQQMSQTPAEEDEIGTLYQCKLDYIGNHSGVGDILSNLTLPEGISSSNEGIELFTNEKPYGARRYLLLDQGGEIPQNGWFEKDAMTFLALVDNASFFEYAITDTKGEEQILHFDREDAAKYFGDTDLRSMAVDESTFRNFMNELEQLFSEDTDYSLRQIECSRLLDEIGEEMGESFSYDTLRNNGKYDELLKLGEGALSEMLIQFGQGQPDDTRGYIMMAACLELLKTSADTIPTLLEEMTPSQWYVAYCALDSVAVLPFQYDESTYTEALEKSGLLPMKNATKEGLITRHSDVMKAVYNAMEQRFSEEGGNREVQIFAPLISHISQKEDKLSVYAVIGLTRYSFLRTPNLGYQLIEGGGSCVPSRLDFEWKDNKWNLVEWVEAKDGSEYTSSIKEMCKGTIGAANDMISYDTRQMQMLLMQNLIFYLNDKTNITVYGNSYMEEKDIQEVNKYISFIQM
ncbi:M56 family metallopeptidase [Anaerotignum sp.]|uniref:M56 family metallopeptidase n=1 Tax=Anaerotignum sp. TaxID=2039241 RepID=UPI002714593A|nr:M56 family metallopeptidase [Anaerotignum sp.]